MPRRDAQGKAIWNPAEPARDRLYQKLYRRQTELDEMMAVLYRQIFELKDRIKQLEEKVEQ